MARDYSEKVKQHYLHPKNVGVVENANAVGEIGSMVCGDALKLTLRITPDTGVIEDARFQTYGCGSAIASSSALTELIKGRTLDEALKITNQDLADYLDGLPEEKMHCSVIGREALQAAAANFRGEVFVHEEDDEFHTVCHCFSVNNVTIENAIRENHLTSVEQVTHYTKAGGACRNCVPEIEQILRRLAPEAQPADASTGGDEPPPMSMFRRIKIIEETLENDIRPALHTDSGGLELLDVSEAEIVVRFLGRCGSCAQSGGTLDFVRARLEKALGRPVTVREVK
jgi:NifU-like protein